MRFVYIEIEHLQSDREVKIDRVISELESHKNFQDFLFKRVTLRTPPIRPQTTISWYP